MSNLDPIRLASSEKLRLAGASHAAIASFQNSLSRLLQGDSGFIPESSLGDLPTIPFLEALPSPSSHSNDLIRKLVVIKLNGGLGTSMGLERAKSLIPVKGHDTFLDLTARQILKLREKTDGTRPAFYLMNSFSTQADTLEFLKSRHPALFRSLPIDFLQGKVPKLDVSSNLPVSWSADPELEWCPPGHGDIYPSLMGSGLLDSLISSGVIYAFVSNSDNLGASVDLRLLEYFAGSDMSFLMEVAQRTSADRKGGHLALRHRDGRLLLREAAQCQPSDRDAFQDIERHRYFNTNNLWVRLDHLKTELDRNGGMLPLPLIANPKTVDPRDPKSTRVVQLETAMGAAIECFQRSGAILVSRQRFAPVKTTGDLLAVRSDAYEVTPDAQLQLVAHRNGVPPLVELDDQHYKTLAGFDRLLGAVVPSLSHCESLKVKGPVSFAPSVTCRGKVSFNNPGSNPWTVAPGAYQDAEFSAPTA